MLAIPRFRVLAFFNLKNIPLSWSFIHSKIPSYTNHCQKNR
jgi:hypothetical protein